MKHILIILSIFLLSFPLFAQSERPETIIIPVSSMGDVSDTRKQILENTLTNELKKHFRIVPQEKYEQVLEQVFEELEYEECSEDTCIMRVQEMLQVENVFNLQIIGEGKDSQLNLTWRTLDEKKNEEDYCKGCGTFELREMIGGLVEKLVGVKKVFMDEPVVQKIEKDKTEGLFVSVGKSGTILTSSDGTSWTKKSSPTFKTLWGVTYGNGLFVMVGSLGNILTSSDGTSWTERTSGISESLNGVTYGNGLFVTVGESGTILTSSDVNSWTKRTSGTSENLVGITYGNGLFVTVGWGTMSSFGTILTSSDGNSWTERNSGTSNDLYGLTYGNGLFVAVGDNGTILTSPDGTTWAKRNSGTSEEFLGVTYGNGIFLTIGLDGNILISPDGTTWTEGSYENSYSYGFFKAATYGNGLFVTVSKNGAIQTSPDGTTWTQRTSGISGWLREVIYSQ